MPQPFKTVDEPLNFVRTVQKVTPLIQHSRQSIKFLETELFVVPKGVTQLRIYAVGAAGGCGNGFGVLLNNSGEGGVAVSNVKVRPGESIEIFVGKRGCDGSLPEGGLGGDSLTDFKGGSAAPGQAGGGGGGGGASGAIRVCGEELLVLAGGGGGGSGVGDGGNIGRGGAGGSFGTNGRGIERSRARSQQANFDDENRSAAPSNGISYGSGGGGGGWHGGVSGLSLDQANTGGEGGSGTIEGSLSSNGGGQLDGLVIVSFDQGDVA